MSTLPKSIQNLIIQFGKLPGIGPKTAQRLTFYLLKQPNIDIEAFARAVNELQKDIIFCSTCFNMAETNPCKICNDKGRNQNLICVLEDPMDVVAMDQISDFSGVYHVLGGVISPLEGVGPDNLKIKELLDRLNNPSEPKEIILATNPSLEGEATAMYIAKQLKSPNYSHIKVTRIGRGLPMGADLEYADEFTLSKALEGRQEF
jgi:recombination protein RecR